ncbi:MAG: hypothetical protein HC925_03760 [Coleofasciculaceae cyanobacterium SM2_3_26]|nr:hypothetical protein [Coleofasciculaceae cyanobacterium SM2_3_26]
MALALHQERAEVESLNGNLEATEYWVQYTLPRAASPLARANLYKLLVLQYALETQYDRATEVGCEALALLGIDLSQEVRATALARELADLRDRLGTQPVTWLLAEPRLEDPTIEVALDLLSGVATASYKSDRDLWLLTVATSVNLGLKHGQSQKLAYAYVCYGIILGSVFGEYHRGYEFGMLARKLGQRYGDRAQICVACAVIASALIPWVRPLAEANPMFEEGQRAGSTSGNLLLPDMPGSTRCDICFTRGNAWNRFRPRWRDRSPSRREPGTSGQSMGLPPCN